MPAKTPTAAGAELPAGAVSVPEVLAHNVRAWRLIRRLDQRAAATRMQSLGHDWVQVTVSEVERSRRNVTVPELIGLAMVLNVTIAELLDSRGPGGRTGPRVALPVSTRRFEVEAGHVTEDMPWFSVDADDLRVLVCSHQRHVEILWDADGMAAMPTRPATPPPAGDGGVARTPSPDAQRVAEAIERLAAAVELLAAPPPEPGPCPAVCPIGLVDRQMPCTLRAGHAGQHEHNSAEGYGYWSDEDGVTT